MELLPDERIDDLQYKGLRLIQNKNLFCFGTDAVLLANFVRAYPKDTLVDLCTGSGIVAFLVAKRANIARAIGVEIYPPMAQMAARSVLLNQMQGQMEIKNMDLIDASTELGREIADVVTCNPPYFKIGTCILSPKEALQIARFETAATLAQCVESAAKLCKNGGRVAFIHQSNRLFDLTQFMKDHQIMPKRIRLVHARPELAPHLVLIEGIKNAQEGFVFLPPLFLQDTEGHPTKEVQQIYHLD